MKGLAILLIVCLLLAMFPASLVMAQTPTGEIVFVSKRDGGFDYNGYPVNTGDIYVMYADGSNIRKLTDTFVDPTGVYEDWDEDNSPAWSPDGTRIAFGRWQDPAMSGDLYVMFADGSGLTNIESQPVDEYNYMHPSWSPDGQKIVHEDEYWDYLHITTPYSGANPGDGRDPDWSPDGAHIVYHYYIDDYINNDIFVMNADGSNKVNLTNDPADDREPAWSPDGTQIAFASNRGGNYDIYIMNADGSGLKRLMNNSADDQEPTWSPDGTHLAFTRIMPNGKGDIFIMNANGSNQTNITNHPEDDYQPDWKPAPQMNIHPVLLVSSTSGGQVGGVRFKDEDILAYDLAAHTWQMYFDGSDVGLGANDVNALGVAWNGDLLLSFNAPQPVSALGTVDDSDIVGFVPTTFGNTTAGAFVTYFTGADWGLTTDGEDIDAIGFTSGNALILSTLGNFTVHDQYYNIAGKDEDLWRRDPWEGRDSGVDMYLDGSTVGLTQPSEDISDVWFNGDALYLSTAGPFTVPGLSGDGADIFIYQGDTFRPFWDGSAHGFGGEVIDAFDIIYATELPVTAAGVDEVEIEEIDDAIGDDVVEEEKEESLNYQNFLPLITQ